MPGLFRAAAVCPGGPRGGDPGHLLRLHRAVRQLLGQPEQAGGAERAGEGGGGQVPRGGRRHGGHEDNLPIPGRQR